MNLPLPMPDIMPLLSQPLLAMVHSIKQTLGHRSAIVNNGILFRKPKSSIKAGSQTAASKPETNMPTAINGLSSIAHTASLRQVNPFAIVMEQKKAGPEVLAQSTANVHQIPKNIQQRRETPFNTPVIKPAEQTATLGINLTSQKVASSRPWQQHSVSNTFNAPSARPAALLLKAFAMANTHTLSLLQNAQSNTPLSRPDPVNNPFLPIVTMHAQGPGTQVLNPHQQEAPNKAHAKTEVHIARFADSINLHVQQLPQALELTEEKIKQMFIRAISSANSSIS